MTQQDNSTDAVITRKPEDYLAPVSGKIDHLLLIAVYIVIFLLLIIVIKPKGYE